MYRAIEQIGRISQTTLKEPHLFSYNKTTNCIQRGYTTSL